MAGKTARTIAKIMSLNRKGKLDTIFVTGQDMKTTLTNAGFKGQITILDMLGGR